MHRGVARSRQRASRQLIWTVILATALSALLLLAALSAVPTAGAIISGAAPTPVPTSASNPGVNIKFKAASSPGVPGYQPDTGAVYGNRGNGYTYGWNRDNAIATFDRNVTTELYDTGIGIHDDPASTSGAAGVWEIALPTGWYHLVIGVGDPSFYNSVFSLQAEGVTIIYATPSSTTRTFVNTPLVYVADGRLTLTSATGAYINQLLFLQIMPRSTPTGRPLYYKTRINFQPANTLPVQNYMSDLGQLYGDRGSGRTFGWSVDNSAWMVERNSILSADQRYDTFAYLRKDSVSRTWEMAVPEGWYWVTIAGGESAADASTKISIKTEGVQVVYQGTDDTRKWLEGHAQVYVSDGKLTVTSSATASHTKINFIEISQGDRDTNGWANVALNKKAKQSSNYESNYAWHAVDGGTDPTLAGGSVAMTGSALESYWEVDLGAVYYLETITLRPRDVNQSRVDNYYILISENAISSTSLSTARSQAGVTSYYQSSPLTASTGFSIGRMARYIRIQLSGTNYLQLAEVEAQSSLPTAVSWQATASSSAAGKPTFYGIDQSAGTAWRSNAPQDGSTFYKVDMRTAQTFSRLTLDSGSSIGYPRGFAVYTTNDSAVFSAAPSSWTSPIISGTGSGQVVNMVFTSQSARYLMIKLIAPSTDYWQIGELTIAP